ncbi:MAG: thiamine phosphate synthase, partial [Acidimicrobiales bacterium]
TLSPINPSASKPGYGPPLGPEALTGLALPTWALGGVGVGNARACVAAGAAGVAVMGAIMAAGDPAAATAAILGQLCETAA